MEKYLLDEIECKDAGIALNLKKAHNNQIIYIPSANIVVVETKQLLDGRVRIQQINLHQWKYFTILPTEKKEPEEPVFKEEPVAKEVPEVNQDASQ